MNRLSSVVVFCLSFCLVSCRVAVIQGDGGMDYASCFDLTGNSVITISPVDGHRDTLEVFEPFSRIVCLSSTHVACLSALGRQDAVAGVNGLRYLSDTVLRSSAHVQEVGDLDLEKVVAMKADLVVASGGGMDDYSRLDAFGIPVIHLYDYMEQHPLARAEYIRLFGMLTGCAERADSVFRAVSDRYARAAAAAASAEQRPSVLVNIPYKDAWYLPGRDSYFARLISDAGAEVAGAQAGSASSLMTVEKAFTLAGNASFWLHPGWCRTLDELKAAHPLFADFGVFGEGKVFNNILKAGPEGGNDYYESGAVRPDLVLEDLIHIFHPELSLETKNASPGDLHYYIELH